jgi:uncharacterized protein
LNIMNSRIAVTFGLWLASALPGAATADAPPAPHADNKVSPTPRAKEARMLDWDALLPDKERANYNIEPPAPKHDYLGEAGRAARQTGSAVVNQKLSETRVKIPGFIVPVVVDDNGVVTEFFLVPYFGACIHVPPPPPNQIVYVKLSSGGIRVGSMEDAFWVTGTLHAQLSGTSLAKAAYTLDATRIELYKY